MNWFSELLRPKIKSDLTTKNDTPKDLWSACVHCGFLLYTKDIPESLGVCHNCGYHNSINHKIRLDYLFNGKYTKIDIPDVVEDPLNFVDSKSYKNRLALYRKKTHQQDVLVVAHGLILDQKAVVACMDFSFMGGSMGMAVGDGILKATNYAVKNHCGFIMVTASGGARMQEGVFSLIQMIRTSIAVQELSDHHLPYIVLLTNPTMGGVTASFAMLGDIHMAEPGALIGFTGRRVIEQTVKEQLPDNFQTAEYLLDKGMIDIISKRHEQKQQLAQILKTFSYYSVV